MAVPTPTPDGNIKYFFHYMPPRFTSTQTFYSGPPYRWGTPGRWSTWSNMETSLKHSAAVDGLVKRPLMLATKYVEPRGIIVNKKLLKDMYSHKSYFDESSYSESSMNHNELSDHEDSSDHAVRVDGNSMEVERDEHYDKVDKQHPMRPKTASLMTTKIINGHRLKDVHHGWS